MVKLPGAAEPPWDTNHAVDPQVRTSSCSSSNSKGGLVCGLEDLALLLGRCRIGAAARHRFTATRTIDASTICTVNLIGCP
jgi:hypothetical protein